MTDWTEFDAEFLRLAEEPGPDSVDALRRKLIEQKILSEQLGLIGSAVHVAGQGIAILTPAVEATGPRIAFVNDGFCVLYGCSRLEVIGQNMMVLGIVERHESIMATMLHQIFNRQPFQAETVARRRDGREFELDVQLVPVLEGDQLTHWVAFLRDITESKSQVGLLRHQAMHDHLTGLPNRLFLLDQFEKAIETARERNTSVALLLMDLDRFKEVNDTFGHQFGDSLLKQIALRLQDQVRVNDTVARLGGDEFAVVVPSANDSEYVLNTARRIISSFEQPFVVDGQVLEVGASIGIAAYPHHGADMPTLLRRADVAMYAAKQAQSGYSFHSDEFESRSPDELGLVVEMRRAIENDEFELHYQPKLHLRTGLMTRAEVLIRWNHPQRGLLLPDAFIHVAERTGIIRNLTDWVFDHALQDCRAWHDNGSPVHLAINVSAKSLQDQMLPARVHALLEKWRIESRFLKIEITESSIMADPNHALEIMSTLQSLGIRLSIDDFGTGYSSLVHLRQLPVDEIKIDKSFVMGMTTADDDAAIVRTVIDLAHNLRKQVCAEGVENRETWWRLDELGCDLVQGYYIKEPMPAVEFMDWIERTSWGLTCVPRK